VSGISNGSAAATAPDTSYILFEGWTWVTCAIAVVNGLGGILVAGTLKYADAVLKCFATAVSIIIVSVIGYFFLDSDIDIFVAIGMLVTVLSVFNYSLDYEPMPLLEQQSEAIIEVAKK
jgi:UDP-sugar transporter A1/2/3